MQENSNFLARLIIGYIGGRDNIIHISQCMTRLRFYVVDTEKVKMNDIRAIPEVFDVFQRKDWFHIVTGSETVYIYNQILKLIDSNEENEKKYSEDKIESNKQNKNDIVKKGKTIIFSPSNGIIKQLSEINDKSFRDKLLGDGVAIIPADGNVYAPCSGVVISAFPTGHALTIRTDEGMEILLHIGLETVNMNGKGFNCVVKSGDMISTGDLLVSFDLDLVIKSGYLTDIIVLVYNIKKYAEMIPMRTGNVNIGDKLFAVIH